MRTRRIYLISVIILTLSFVFLFGKTKTAQALPDLKGRILLQVEDKGQAWYVNPFNQQRYYLGRPLDAFNLMRDFGLGASNADIDSFLKKGAPSRLAGQILLRVQDLGQAYYIDPVNLKLYYLGRPADAFRVIRERGLGITNTDLSRIAVFSNSREFRRFNFKYGNRSYQITSEMSPALYQNYINSPKVYSYPAGQAPDNIREAFYGLLMTRSNNDRSIEETINLLRSLVFGQGLSADEFAEFVLAFVQYIPYDQAKLDSGINNPYYPYETLYLNKGVCSDKTFLAVLLLRQLGYGAAVIDMPEINHTAVGIQCPQEYSLQSSGYCYVETTNYFPLGVIPQSIRGQAQTNTRDFNHLFDSSTLGKIEILQASWGKTYSGIITTRARVETLKAEEAESNRQLIELRASESTLNVQEAELKTIKSQMDGYLANGQTEQYNLLVLDYNSKTEQYNSALAAYRNKVEEYNKTVNTFNADLKDFYQQ